MPGRHKGVTHDNDHQPGAANADPFSPHRHLDVSGPYHLTKTPARSGRGSLFGETHDTERHTTTDNAKTPIKIQDVGTDGHHAGDLQQMGGQHQMPSGLSTRSLGRPTSGTNLATLNRPIQLFLEATGLCASHRAARDRPGSPFLFALLPASVLS